MSSSISVTYRVEEGDYLAGQRLSLWKGPYRRMGLLMLALPVLVFVLAIGSFLLGKTAYGVAMLAVAIFLVLLRWLFMPRGWRQAYRADQRWQRDITFQASPEHVVFDTPVSHAVVDWALFSEFIESERVMLLFQPGRIANILPTRAFTPDQLERLRELVRENLRRTAAGDRSAGAHLDS
jgi:YcxB-like protein